MQKNTVTQNCKGAISSCRQSFSSFKVYIPPGASSKRLRRLATSSVSTCEMIKKGGGWRGLWGGGGGIGIRLVRAADVIGLLFECWPALVLGNHLISYRRVSTQLLARGMMKRGKRQMTTRKNSVTTSTGFFTSFFAEC